MTTFHLEQRPAGHDHGVQLDDTFDFINTLENDANDGTPNEHLPSAEQAVQWFAERGLIHAESLDASEKDLERIRTVRAALREVADAVVESRAPKPSSLDRVNRTLRARAATELVAGPDGIGIGHRHVGDPINDALARVTEPLVQEAGFRQSGAPARVCQRPLPLGVLRRVARGPAALVRDGELRQPGQGRAASRSAEGGAGWPAHGRADRASPSPGGSTPPSFARSSASGCGTPSPRTRGTLTALLATLTSTDAVYEIVPTSQRWDWN